MAQTTDTRTTSPRFIDSPEYRRIVYRWMRQEGRRVPIDAASGVDRGRVEDADSVSSKQPAAASKIDSDPRARRNCVCVALRNEMVTRFSGALQCPLQKARSPSLIEAR
jgi:hypothetical protein